jgi:hypothetical protein
LHLQDPTDPPEIEGSQMMKNLFKSPQRNPTQEIISILNRIKTEEISYNESIIQKVKELFDSFEVNKVLEQLWMKHYLDELNSKDKSAHSSFIKNIEKMSDDFNKKNIETSSIAARLIALYLSCKIPNSSTLIEDKRGADIFENYLAYGRLNLNPPSKHRHLFLDNLN